MSNLPRVVTPPGWTVFVTFDHVHIHDSPLLSRFPVDASEIIAYKPKLIVGHLAQDGSVVHDVRSYKDYAELLQLMHWLPNHQWLVDARSVIAVHPRRVLGRLLRWATPVEAVEVAQTLCSKLTDAVDLFHGNVPLTFEERQSFGQPQIERYMGLPSLEQSPESIINRLNTVCLLPKLTV